MWWLYDLLLPGPTLMALSLPLSLFLSLAVAGGFENLHIMKLSSSGEINSEQPFKRPCPRAVEGEQECTCRVASECLECDPFEIATDAQHEGEVDEGWCAATGHKQLLECEYGEDSTVFTVVKSIVG